MPNRASHPTSTNAAPAAGDSGDVTTAYRWVDGLLGIASRDDSTEQSVTRARPKRDTMALPAGVTVYRARFPRGIIRGIRTEEILALRPVDAVREDPAFLKAMEDSERECRVRDLDKGDWVREFGSEEWGIVRRVNVNTLRTDRWDDEDTDGGDHVVAVVRMPRAESLLAQYRGTPFTGTTSTNPAQEAPR